MEFSNGSPQKECCVLRGAPEEMPRGVFTLKIASSLDSAVPWETVKTMLSFTHFSSQTAGRFLTMALTGLLAFAFAVLSSQVPFLPTELLAHACYMSPLRAFPDTHPNQFPKEPTPCGVITCFHISHQTRL